MTGMPTMATEHVAIGTIKKNSREEIRVSLEVWHGRRIVNARVYFRAEDGLMYPSRKGLALSVDRLPELLAVLTEAMGAVTAPEARGWSG
jgi:hypothetical protein